MKQKDLFAFVLMALILGISLTSIAYTLINDIETKEMPYDVAIDDYIGINADPGGIHFGVLVPGSSSSTRKVNITNAKKHPIRFMLRPEGEFSEFISLSDREFALLPEETLEVQVSFIPPADTPFGNYSGVIKVHTRKGDGPFS